MFLALNGTLLAGAKLSWPDTVRLAARVGFPGVDVFLSPAMAEGVKPTRSLLEHLRLRPSSIGFPVEFRKDEETFSRDLPKLEPAAKFGVAIGCPRMHTWVPASSATPKAELRAAWLKRFRASAEILARSGVRLGLEFLGPKHLRTAGAHEFIWRMDEMLAFARECGPNVGLLLDAWHWHHAGGTTDDIVKAGKDAIVHVHVNDSAKLSPDEVRDNQRLWPGDGVIDLTGFFRALDKIGYRDAVSVEVFGDFLKGMEPEKAALTGFLKARGAMQKAGVNWNA